MVGSAKTHQKQRARFRRLLESEGVPPEAIERKVAKLADRQRAQRLHAAADRELVHQGQEAREAETYARLSPSDAGYRPSSPDPLLRGPARVTSMTARAAARRRATTRYEYDRLDGEAS
jgi:hypothetical protein